jgi:hypothetical protein
VTSPSLQDLSQALRDLHKTLLDAELDNFPMARGTADRLSLAVEHPSFAWLHALSELIVEFDELADAGDVTAAKLRQGRDAVERLLGPLPASNADFRGRYLEYLQLVPDVALATGAVRRLLSK